MAVYDSAKRALDVLGASVALVASLPIQAIIAILVKRKLGSPVLFRQPRPGQNEEIFELVKFRTMLNVDPDLNLVTDEQRLVPLGSFLRSTSLDELPTLWNVLRGDMSLVGPRPLLASYLARYTPEQRRRHEVRPGVTGLAQVSGRNAITWDEKFEMDVQYVDRRSFTLDLKIVWRTVAQVIRRQGISAEGQATMSEYLGQRDA